MQPRLDPRESGSDSGGNLSRVFRASRAAVHAYAWLGLLCALLSLLFPWVASDAIAGLLLVALPAGATGYWLLTRAALLHRTFIAVGGDGLRLQIPVWMKGRLGPLRQADIRWGDIRRIVRRRVRYGMAPLQLDVDEYDIETTEGSCILTRNICPEVEEAIFMISRHTGLEVLASD